MSFPFRSLKAGLGLALVSLALTAAPPASATICFTSGKVYMQQKVYDKATYFLECARKAEPENIDALSLLAVARSEQHQYLSAGAAFQLALDLAKKKNDTKKIADIERNRLSSSDYRKKNPEKAKTSARLANFSARARKKGLTNDKEIQEKVMQWEKEWQEKQAKEASEYFSSILLSAFE